MQIKIKTKDEEIHIFRSTDAFETLQNYKLDIDVHVFMVKTITAEYIFPLENVFWLKIVEKDA